MHMYGMDEDNESAIRNPLESLHAQRDQHYSQVLALFDEAIENVRMSAIAGEAVHSPAMPSSVQGPIAGRSTIPPATTTQPRRSARIRSAQLAKSDKQLPSRVTVPQLAEPKFSAPPTLAPEPRRSSRILKRRLEEEDQQGAPPSKSRKTKSAPRSSKRTR
ncbi:hypothetical protein FA13DRAFT_1523572 [Coprinellus micaceus]|uniref:Uncharacterized protein n=1 Tax=Coprinellus micaceus TaxID=71717 RepID=A0A4Y7SJP0_COPMI|nr:hypothetical protein FA13DRAFT_1523572 [Coprinellus micaceus]